ncbi:hypothetical protein PVAND_017080 [Polypedilum vanderplanki]|uniref:Uncharacterized protein n=1 Tax=Polypedilum vanderplanki TaxID=319348 RepID=A0A9J6BHK2_POLVA|nr:hypothetical protein PVAND_017080 [Polypedilum vanderplanki]
MKIKLFAILTLLCALVFLTADALTIESLSVEDLIFERHHLCSNERKDCERGFYFNRIDCKCHCGLKSIDCFYPQQLNKTACECQCPPELNESKCINLQEWDDDWCECYCPYSKDRKCPSKKVWNYNNCNCDCIDKEPKEGCVNGKWNKNECQCIPNPTPTNTTTKSTATTMAISTVTTVQTTTITTIQPLLCSYGTKAYNNDNSIDGIIAGTAVDGTIAYVGFTEIDGITVPGTLMLNNSVLPGLNYIYNNTAIFNQKTNVYYFTNTADCNCQFVDKNSTLPIGSYIVTLNNGTHRYHVGKYDNAGKAFNITASAVGAIIRGVLHYFNGYERVDSNTTDYKILICGPPSNVTSTTTLVLTTFTNVNSTTTSSSSGTTVDYAKELDDKANEFLSTAMAAVHTLMNMSSLRDEMVFGIHYYLADDNTTTKAEVEVYTKVLEIMSDPALFANGTTAQNSSTGQRRKRQTMDTCQNATLVVQNATNALNQLQARYRQVQAATLKAYNSGMNNTNFTIRSDAHPCIEEYLAELRNLTIQIQQLEQQLNDLIAVRDKACSQTTTTTATTTTTKAPCFYLWGTYPGKNVVPSDGLYVGKNPYGNDIYVGAGTANSDLAPGSLEPKFLNGVTTETGYVVYNVTTDVKYLVAPPTACTCNWLPNVNVYSTPALVRLRDYYWIGRYTFADGSYVVGKIYDQGSGPVMSHAENNQEIQTNTFDVLQCLHI